MHLGSFVQMYSEVRYNGTCVIFSSFEIRNRIMVTYILSCKMKRELRKGLIIIYLSFKSLLRIDSHDKGFDIK